MAAMTFELRKFHLIEMIMSIRDETLLKKYEEMARIARIEAYESGLKPMSSQEYKKQVLEAEKDIEEGRLISIENLQKQVEY